MAETIAFHGLGVMGLNMACRLVDSAFTVYGYDTNTERSTELVARGGLDGAAVEMPSVDIVIMMLPNAAAIESVVAKYCNGDAAQAGMLFLDCSTTDIDVTRRLDELATAKGHSFVDAPVSGGFEMAAKGELSFMVGGTDESVQRLEPLFNLMGQRFVHFGETSSGQAVKACNNMAIGISMIALSEGFALAKHLGLDQHKLAELWLNAGMRSWLLENRCPAPDLLPDVPSSKGYVTGFASELMVKDLAVAQRAAKNIGVEMPFGAKALAAYEDFVANGNAALDFSAIYKTYFEA